METHQNRSVPFLIARQAGVQGFQQPLISEPGIPPELTLVSLLPAPLIAPKASTAGAPKNLALARPYNNLAVPGATTVDALTRTTDAGGLHDVILRGMGTQGQQAGAVRPTAITLWIGNNDVLGAALRGRAVDGVTLTPTDAFRATLRPDRRRPQGDGRVHRGRQPAQRHRDSVRHHHPALRGERRGPARVDRGEPRPPSSAEGPPSNSLVTLAASSLLAQGIGIPSVVGGTGTPLPDEVVLNPSEIAIIQDHVNVNNKSIRDICGAANIPVLDVQTILNELYHRDPRGRITLTVLSSAAGLSATTACTERHRLRSAREQFINVFNANGGALHSRRPRTGPGRDQRNRGHRAGGRAARVVQQWVPFEFSMEAYADLLKAFPRLDEKP